MTRRSFFQVSAGGAITLPEFQPKSMLHVAQHPVDSILGTSEFGVNHRTGIEFDDLVLKILELAHVG